MTSLPFDYERPDSLKQALSLIAEPGSVLLVRRPEPRAAS